MKIITRYSGHFKRLFVLFLSASLCVVEATTVELDSDANNRGELQYAISKSVMVSGQKSQAGPYVLTAGIGQTVIGQSVSSQANYQFSAGFFMPNRDLIFRNNFENNE